MAYLSRKWESRAQSNNRPPWGSRNVPSTTTPINRFVLRNQPTTETVLNRPAPINPRHRRSKSVGGGGLGSKNASMWLEHKENFAAPLGTIFSPNTPNKRKSASTIELKDTLKASNYVLHHQTADQEGNVKTQLFKVSY